MTKRDDELMSLRNENAQLTASVAELEQSLEKSRESEYELKLSEEKFRLLFQNASDEIIHIDRRGSIIDVNETIEDITGYTREEVLGRNLEEFDITPPGSVDRLYDIYRDRIEHGQGHFGEAQLKHRDGHTVIIETRGSQIVRDGHIEGVLLFIRDITERKRWEEKLAELYHQEKALREQIEAEMKRRVDYTRMLAHELKTPLTSVVSSSDSLLTELAEMKEDRLLNLATNINRGASNLRNRVDELLDLAKGEVGVLEVNPEPADLLQMLRDTVDSLAPLAESQAQLLRLESPSSLPMVRADIPRIQQVVMNLLGNALKFTPRGGKIKIRAYRKENDVVIDVQDTGPGLSKDEQSRVFEPYQRVAGEKGRLGGLGLGLALCKRLVDLHGGKIWVRSHPRQGAIFGFSLPLEHQSQLPAQLSESGKLWRVLIIEDDQEITRSVSLAFQKDWPQAELIWTRMGEEGVEFVETEDPDIVILDLGLPDMDGFEALQRIRSFSTVPIVIVTVRDEEMDIARGLELGANDYITKPFRNKELVARLQARLRQQIPNDVELPIICGSLCLSPDTFQLSYGAREISLTTVEGQILLCLMNNQGHVVTHTRLAEEIWGEEYPGAIVALRSHIRRLRGKLEADQNRPRLIMTKASIGYWLARPD